MKLRLWVLVIPFLFIYLGAASNLLVISANQGAMPVSLPFSKQCAHDVGTETPEFRDCVPGEKLDHVHRAAKADDHLTLLSDWIQVPWIPAEVSPGDCFMWLGDFLEYPLIAAWLALLIIENRRRSY